MKCLTNSFGDKFWFVGLDLHREDGLAIEFVGGGCDFYLNNKWLDPKKVIDDPEINLKYPKLIESMIIYLIHEV